jgi:hypothetical protein
VHSSSLSGGWQPDAQQGMQLAVCRHAQGCEGRSHAIAGDSCSSEGDSGRGTAGARTWHCISNSSSSSNSC